MVATTKLKSPEALPDVWKDGIESAEFKAGRDVRFVPKADIGLKSKFSAHWLYIRHLERLH